MNTIATPSYGCFVQALRSTSRLGEPHTQSTDERLSPWRRSSGFQTLRDERGVKAGIDARMKDRVMPQRTGDGLDALDDVLRGDVDDIRRPQRLQLRGAVHVADLLREHACRERASSDHAVAGGYPVQAEREQQHERALRQCCDGCRRAVIMSIGHRVTGITTRSRHEQNMPGRSIVRIRYRIINMLHST